MTIPQVVFVYFHYRICFLSKSIWLKTSCKIPELIVGFGEHYLVNSFICFSHQFLKYFIENIKKEFICELQMASRTCKKIQLSSFYYVHCIQQPIPNFQNSNFQTFHHNSTSCVCLLTFMSGSFFFLSKSICLKISCKIPELIIGFGEHYLVSSFSCISHQFLKYLSTTSKKKSFVNCKWPPGLVRKYNFPASSRVLSPIQSSI